MTDIEAPTPDHDDAGESSSDRRALLTKLALGGAGAAVGAVALGRTASAADTDPLTLGEDNQSTSPTVIENDEAAKAEGPSTFSVAETRPANDAPFPARVGGYGDDKIANGVHGSTTAKAGFGTVAASLAGEATASEKAPAGLAVASAYGPQIKFVKLDTNVAGPTSGLHDRSEMYVDADGVLWFTVPAPTTTDPDAVRFVKLAGTGTSGALSFYDFPERNADTRLGVPGSKPAVGGNIVVDLKKKVDGTASSAPASFSAALLTVTVTNTVDRGFFAVAAAGITLPSSSFSSGNWVGDNLSVAQTVQTRVSPEGFIQIQLGGIGNCDVVVDTIATYA